MANHHELANLIWQIADLLRGPYRPPQYEEIFARFMNDAPFQKVVTAWLASEAYRKLRGVEGKHQPGRVTSE